jgi:nucleoid-associated protein YgaU
MSKASYFKKLLRAPALFDILFRKHAGRPPALFPAVRRVLGMSYRSPDLGPSRHLPIIRWRRAILFVPLSIVFFSNQIDAQDVAEAARQNQARKDSQQKPAHVYTDDDLKKDKILTSEDQARVEARKKQQKATPCQENAQVQPLPLDPNAPQESLSLGEIARRYRLEKAAHEAEEAAKNIAPFPYTVPNPTLASPAAGLAPLTSMEVAPLVPVAKTPFEAPAHKQPALPHAAFAGTAAHGRVSPFQPRPNIGVPPELRLAEPTSSTPLARSESPGIPTPVAPKPRTPQSSAPAAVTAPVPAVRAERPTLSVPANPKVAAPIAAAPAPAIRLNRPAVGVPTAPQISVPAASAPAPLVRSERPSDSVPAIPKSAARVAVAPDPAIRAESPAIPGTAAPKIAAPVSTLAAPAILANHRLAGVPAAPKIATPIIKAPALRMPAEAPAGPDLAVPEAPAAIFAAPAPVIPTGKSVDLQPALPKGAAAVPVAAVPVPMNPVSPAENPVEPHPVVPNAAVASPLAPVMDPRGIHSIEIQRGDNWWKLALRYLGNGARWQELRTLNHAESQPADLLKLGAVILVPQSSTLQTPRPNNEVIIKKGDTLWALARNYFGHGSQWTCLATANPQISAPTRLAIDLTLTVPERCAPAQK